MCIGKDLTAHYALTEKTNQLALLRERQRIAMDLHDGAVQSLYALGMSLAALGIGARRASKP